jgi:hypothetical protein
VISDLWISQSFAANCCGFSRIPSNDKDTCHGGCDCGCAASIGQGSAEGVGRCKYVLVRLNGTEVDVKSIGHYRNALKAQLPTHGGESFKNEEYHKGTRGGLLYI